jgi:hypothetical protein
MSDPEPPQSVYFPSQPGTDSRFIKGFAFKPTIEGTNMTLQIRAYAGSNVANRRIVGGTLVASATCPGITVTP